MNSHTPPAAIVCQASAYGVVLFSFSASTTTSTGGERDGARAEGRKEGRSLIAPVHPTYVPSSNRLILYGMILTCLCLRAIIPVVCAIFVRSLVVTEGGEETDGGGGGEKEQGEGRGWSDRWRCVWSGFDKGTELCGLSAASLVIIYVDYFFSLSFFFKRSPSAPRARLTKSPGAPHCARLGCGS